MTRFHLTRIAIEGFRGINNEGDPLILSFKPDAVNSVFGLNGLGKSSIYDALTYAFKNDIPKFANLPAADTPGEYYTNRFHTAKTATIELEFLPDDGGQPIRIVVSRSATGVRSVTSTTGQTDPDNFLRQFGSGTALMDYRAFGQFVDDTPLKRGRTFSSLLGLGLLSEYRQALETLANTRSVKNDFDLETLTYQLTNARTKEREVSGRVIKAHRALLGSDVSIPIERDSTANGVRAALKRIAVIGESVAEDAFAINFGGLRTAIKIAEGSAQRDRLAEVIKQQRVYTDLAPSQEEDASQRRCRELLQERDAALATTRGLLVQRLYEAGKTVVESPQWSLTDSCPLCDTTDLDEPIASHIDRHLKAYETARSAENQLRALLSTASWASRLVRLSQLLHPPGIDESVIDSTFRSGPVDLALLEDAIKRLSKLNEERVGTLDQLRVERESIETTLPPSLVTVTEQVEYAEQIVEGLRTLQNLSTEITELSGRLKLRERWATFIDKAAKLFAEAEVALSTAKTIALQGDYEKLYHSVTRNPDVVPLLKKAPESEELLLRLAKFYGLSDVSAATLLPESYRNALAICIFLAASQKREEPARFMVLDDITSSFDNGHQFGLMELLRTTVAIPGNPLGPQIILLSHDGSLEKYFDKTANENVGWSHQRLQGMPPQGMVLTQHQDALRLRSAAERFLNAGQIQEAAPFIRQYLEFSLLRIIQKLGIPVPIDFAIRDDQKMANNCLKAIQDCIDLHKRAGDLVLSATQQNDIRTALVPSVITNWINHYSTGTIGGLSPHVLLGVLDDIDKLTECFKYSCQCTANTTQKFYRSLVSKQCTC